MIRYKPYPTKKDTPSRKSRKSERAVVFEFNKKAKKRAAQGRSIPERPDGR